MVSDGIEELEVSVTILTDEQIDVISRRSLRVRNSQQTLGSNLRKSRI